MELTTGLVLGLVAAAGAVWRGYKGYQNHMAKRKYEAFDWKKFAISVLPAAVLGFVAGATYTAVPEKMLSQEGLTLMMVFFTGGAGVGTLQSKLPGTKPKK